MWRLIVGVVMVGSSCGPGPLDVFGEQRLAPLPEYRVWWSELQTCAEREREFDEIVWWTAESVAIAGEDKIGAWLPPHHIVIASFYITSGPAVKHEMLHHLTDGAMPHSAPEFTACTTVDGTTTVAHGTTSKTSGSS